MCVFAKLLGVWIGVSHNWYIGEATWPLGVHNLSLCSGLLKAGLTTGHPTPIFSRGEVCFEIAGLAMAGLLAAIYTSVAWGLTAGWLWCCGTVVVCVSRAPPGICLFVCSQRFSKFQGPKVVLFGCVSKHFDLDVPY